MMERKILLFLKDIENSIEKIKDFSRGKKIGDFLEDLMTQSATIRELEVIGEAVKNIPEDFRKKYPEVEWKKIAGFRDVLIHNYFGADLERIWVVVELEIPSLEKQIKEIIEKEEER